MPFLDADFFLGSNAARRLYHEFAAGEPILDYHNHLPPADIATNRQFANLTEIWLEGDHYKWRAMRANGEPEVYITGAADPYDKFLAWARTVPHTLRNPLYHWTHLELRRTFGIETLLNESTAPEIWAETELQLSAPSMRVHGLLAQFQVRALCTTDDPTDDLAYHMALSNGELATRVYPAFRPDRAMAVQFPAQWNRWTDALSAISDIDCGTLDGFLAALSARHEAFHALGGRLSDHGMNACPARRAEATEANRIFAKARAGEAATPEEADAFAGFVLHEIARWNAEQGWTMQLHLGPVRNNNSRAFAEVGPDAGYDSIGQTAQAERLGAFLDRLAADDALPKMIVYNVNPTDNYAVSTMIGNFAGGIPGKMQFGAAWWYLDAKDGIEWQLNALSNNGLLSRFVGMLTDSRSFLSFPRHEYFRRILCNLLGREMDAGELPDDVELVGGMVRRICYANARDFLALEVPA